MTTSKKSKKAETAKEVSVIKEVEAEKRAPKKKEPVKKQEVKVVKPKFKAKEVLVLSGRECVFVEKIKGKVLVRFSDGTYSSAKEEMFSLPR